MKYSCKLGIIIADWIGKKNLIKNAILCERSKSSLKVRKYKSAKNHLEEWWRILSERPDWLPKLLLLLLSLNSNSLLRSHWAIAAVDRHEVLGHLHTPVGAAVGVDGGGTWEGRRLVTGVDLGQVQEWDGLAGALEVGAHSFAKLPRLSQLLLLLFPSLLQLLRHRGPLLLLLLKLLLLLWLQRRGGHIEGIVWGGKWW